MEDSPASEMDRGLRVFEDLGFWGFGVNLRVSGLRGLGLGFQGARLRVSEFRLAGFGGFRVYRNQFTQGLRISYTSIQGARFQGFLC